MQITISTRENEEGGEIGGERERERERGTEEERQHDTQLHNNKQGFTTMIT